MTGFRCHRMFSLIAVWIAWSCFSSAQEPAAILRGSVYDPKGVPVVRAQLAARNLETGLSRTASSDEQGSFELRPLPPGNYEVQASGPGFQPQSKSPLELRSGQIVTVEFPLQAEGAASAGPPSQGSDGRAATAPNSGGLIGEAQLAGLPLNGRSYSQLATLQSGVSDPFASSASRGGGSGGLTVSGGRPASNNFLLDGISIMDTRNRVPRSAAGVQLGSDAVLQVQVLAVGYGAEYGRSSGGVLNSITRSGSSEFHGTFFEFFRNSKLDARNFFDPGPEPTPFKRNQFGFTVSGPVVQDKSFFMGSFEALRDRLTETDISFFPDALARQGVITDAAGTVTQTIAVHPAVAPYLALYPLPNSTPLGRGVGQNAASQFLPTSENFFTVRLDQRLSEKDSFFVRYTFDDASSRSGVETFLFQRQTTSRQQYLSLVGSHVFGPRLLGAFRFGYTRPVEGSESHSNLEIPRSLFFNPDSPEFGLIDVPGLSDFGPFPIVPQADIMNSFQYAGDFLAQRGDHALKLGFEAHRYRNNGFSSSNKGGSWSFNSLESFLRSGPQGTTLSVALPGSDNSHAYRQTLAAFYFSDSVTLGPRFRLNLGLRYEFVSNLNDNLQRTVFLPDPVRDTEVQVGPYLEHNPSPKVPAPRLGLAWSPGSSGNTQVTASFGIYYDQFLGYFVVQRKASAPYYKKAVRSNFNAVDLFPHAVPNVQGLPFQVQVLDYRNAVSPMVLRYSMAVQQQLAGGWRLRASYVGARGNHLFRDYEANLFPVVVRQADGSLFFPEGEGPVNPALGSLTIISSDAQSFYNSLQLSASRSFGEGMSVQAGYTYSKSVDDSSTHTNDAEQYGLARTLERSLSDYDIRHRLVASYFVSSPFGPGRRWGSTSWLSALLGGWRLGGIFSFRTGTPFSPQVRVRTPGFLFAATRPDLLPGKSNNPVLGGPDRYFDSSAYAVQAPGTLGTAGRNTITAPDVIKLDISLQREFFLDARRRLQFRAEFFNLPNHSNFDRVTGASAIVFSGASGRLNPSAGRITETNTTARQIQFALRFSF